MTPPPPAKAPEPVQKAPFPYFGGKSRVVDQVWQRFGDVANYVEPFAGSLAVLLGRPHAGRIETVNDLNGWLANFWRALRADPEAVAEHADYPVSELDLHARGDWLFYRPGVAEWIEQLRADPGYYCAKSAGWWVWGQCCWIGSGWGPQMRDGEAVGRQLPHLGNAGQGVNRKRPHLSNAGRGVNRKRPHLGSAGQGDEPQTPPIYEYLAALSDRLKRVRVCCGDWSRVCGPSVTFKHGLTGVFLDPPYGATERHDCYEFNSYEVAGEVRAWCLENGPNPLMRIALCGYEGEHNELEAAGWSIHEWKPRGGFDGQRVNGENNNRERERVWFSPACLAEREPMLFGPEHARVLGRADAAASRYWTEPAECGGLSRAESSGGKGPVHERRR